MKTLLPLLLCVPAYAAPLPPSPIKRPLPLFSPKHASQPKSRTMVKATTLGTSTEPRRLPMKAYHNRVQSEFGTDELTAEALQPANQSVLFKMTPDNAPGSTIPLAYFSPYYKDQPVFAGITTHHPMMVITAEATPVMPSNFVRLTTTTGPAIWVNPAVRGSFARRGVR